MSARRTFGAFTLIELLVVVAIIALLISILLPALSRAKEQAKKTQCVANLHSIGQAMHMYFDESNEWFPFEKANLSLSSPVHAFYYGGHPGRPGWWGYDNADYRDSPGGRPFNKYLYGNLSKELDSPSDQGTAQFEQRRKLPIYECPSDVGGYYNSNASTNEELEPTHYTTGSSYDSNYYSIWNWFSTPPGDGHPTRWRTVYLQRANAFLQKQLQNYASQFVILFEDPLDSAVYNYIPRRGWHREWNKHSVLFLDGHAGNIFTDTIAGHSGKGWKLSGGNSRADSRAWWNNPDDPDYKWRFVSPRGRID